MFRKPREHVSPIVPGSVTPSTGRPPTPPSASGQAFSAPHGGVGMSSTPSSKNPPTPRSTTMLNGAPRGSAGASGRSKPKSNGSILTFFKKVDSTPRDVSEDAVGAADGLFFGSTDAEAFGGVRLETLGGLGTGLDSGAGVRDYDDAGFPESFNESSRSAKRRRTESTNRDDGLNEIPEATLSSTKPETKTNGQIQGLSDGLKDSESASAKVHPTNSLSRQESAESASKARRVGPFVEDSDSEDETSTLVLKFENERPRGLDLASNGSPKGIPETKDNAGNPEEQQVDEQPDRIPSLKREATSIQDDDVVGDLEAFGEEYPDGEEYLEREWMEGQRRLELMESGIEDDFPDDAGFEQLPEDKVTARENVEMLDDSSASCPICSASLTGISDSDAQLHVNHCLDGNPIPLPKSRQTQPSKGETNLTPNRFQRAVRPAKPGQANPFNLGSSKGTPSSAFSKLMSSHAEDTAWATAAAEEQSARGKPAYQRTCPFYKILPGFSICVDAFRYGAVEGCQAYFLSHFHSDHYVGLTSNWQHGPIYCSRVTANLVRQQLRVNPKYVIDLEFEKKIEVPRTNGVEVTMIPANHCPGSSLFLFEKVLGKGKNPKIQRVLHCGDFRACPAHLEHPLLRPGPVDVVSGKHTGQQKIDVCYLDTTYLNPRYAFPSQEEVIQACADMCVSLKKERADENDEWEKVKRERAGSGMTKFVRTNSPPAVKDEEMEEDDVDAMKVSTKSGGKDRGRLLVVVGTYSIGKERICMGIAKALDSKIFAPAGKQRICACLEDGELDARLTTDPLAAQVHMTPLFEIRAETLQEYLDAYRPHFSRVVGFRPSGWNYRPPNSRFVESPGVPTVLHSANWRSTYSMAELVPQRGSSRRAACFGVPYSEHSSFRELTMFCCALRIDKIIPTVNVGSARSRERMKAWFDKWAAEKKKNGLFRLEEGDKTTW